MTQPRVEASDAPKRKLVADLLQSQRTVRLQALGTSMLPTLWPGDLLTIEPFTADEARIGDILLVVCEDRLFIHRLVQAGSPYGVDWVTRGDAMPACDPAVASEDIVGRVCQISRDGDELSSPRQLSPLVRAFSAMIAHSDFVRRAALRGHSIWQMLRALVLPAPSSGKLRSSVTVLLREE
jgi:hypothetical protein